MDLKAAFGRGRQRANLLAWLLSGLVLLSALAVLWIVHSATRRTDEVAAAHEQRLAANGFELRKREMRRTVMTETVWDDAVRNLDLRFDRSWAEANMTTFFTATSGYELVVVLDGQDRPAIAHLVNGDVAKAWPQIHGDVQRMLASIRTREAGIHRSSQGLPSKTLISNAVDATTVVRIDGAPFILTAALVQPDFGTALPSRRAPVVLVGNAIDQGFLSSFGAAYLLHDARLVAHAADAGEGRAILPIRNQEGAVVGRLSWRPEAPARDLVDHISLPLGALAMLLILLAVAMFSWERRRALQLKAARDEAEEASIAKSEFLANMSHEIRTPLNGVMGVAGALARTPLSPPQAEMVSLIETSAKTLETLLSDILDLARIEAGKMELRPEPFDLATSVNACSALFDAAAQAKGLDLEVAIAPDALGAYVGDAARLRQVLSNLLGNAVKFTQEGGVRLTVQARRGETSSQLRFEVRDTGIGFDAETKARLFSRFEQADGSITRRFGGSGLGLSISRSLAEAMGGRLEADAEPGQGAVFTLTLELPRGEGALDLWGEAAPPEPAADPLAGMRVLLAEDHPTNRRVVELILGAAGVDLTCVENGVEAVAAFRSRDFDLILMDMQMPLLDGLAAVQEIRRLEALSGVQPTPIHMLTANAMPEHISASMRAGADGHLSKPILADALLERVAEAAATRPVVANDVQPARLSSTCR